jgi:hypothetical protein
MATLRHALQIDVNVELHTGYGHDLASQNISETISGGSRLAWEIAAWYACN